ncbi:MAG: CBS domain-containing protein [Thermoplasmata archaeon]|nr:CBS domain-containing protein [Thermoplasmata archaeon]
MHPSARVSEIMTQPVIRVRPDVRLAEAARLMREHHISGLPVTDSDDRLVGIISEIDILRTLHKAAGIASPRGILGLVLEASPATGPGLLDVCRRRLENGLVAESMTERVTTIDPETSLGEAARLIQLNGVNRLPVIDVERRVVGIVTRFNLVEAISGKPRASRGRLAPKDRAPAPKVGSAVAGRRSEERHQRIWGGV